MSVTQAGRALADELRAHGIGSARLAFVLGSGLGNLADSLEDVRSVGFEELDAMPASGVPGHAGRFVQGRFGGCEVLVQQGRLHLYEGHSVQRVTRSVRAFAELGVRGLVLTNAAGGLVPDWPIPTLMRITDHLNLQPKSPLQRCEVGRGTPYDETLGALLDRAAEERGMSLQRGVYAGLLGPSYETAAEIRMLDKMGAQAVGMSTVAEALAAHAAGLSVVGISCISNPAAGISTTPLDHDEVVAAGKAIAEDFAGLLEAATSAWARHLTVEG